MTEDVVSVQTAEEGITATQTLSSPMTGISLQINRDILHQGLRLVSGVIETAQVLQILSHVKIDAEGSQLSLTATDSEVELKAVAQLDTPVAQPFTATVSGRKLMDICRTLPAKSQLTLMLQDNWLTLTTDRSTFKLASLPSASFPQIQLQDPIVSFHVPEQDLHYLLSRTSFAMAYQDARYFLNAMLWEMSADSLRVVATDGHRLATNRSPLRTELQAMQRVILPRKGVLELVRLLESTGEQAVEVTLTPNHLRVVTPQVVYTSNLFEGQYPDCDKLIPPRGETQLRLSREEFKQALQRAAILANEKFKAVKLQFGANELKVLSSNAEHEKTEEVLPVEYQGEPLNLAFNITYLLDILGVLSTDGVVLSLGASGGSVTLGEEGGNEESIFVVMPLTI